MIHMSDLRTLLADRERLRGLIVDAASIYVGGPGPCIVCGGTLPDHRDHCPGPPLLAEARAIQAERLDRPE